MGKYNDRKRVNYGNKSIKKWVGISLIVFGLVMFIFACIPNFVMNRFVLGTFGICAYPIFLAFMLIGIALAMNMTYKGNAKFATLIGLFVLSFLGLLHSIFSVSGLNELQFGEYLAHCYNLTDGVTIGGVILGFICDVISLILGGVGTCIFFGILTCVLGGFTIDYAIYNKNREALVTPERANKFNQLSNDFEENEKQDLIAPKYESVEVGDEDAEELEQNNKTDAQNLLFKNMKENNAEMEIAENKQPKSAKEILFGERSVPNIYTSTDEERKAWLEAHPVEEKKEEKTEKFDLFNNYNNALEEDDEQISNIATQSASEMLFGSNRFSLKNEDEMNKDKALNILGMNNRRNINNEEEEKNINRRGFNAFNLDNDEEETNYNSRTRNIENFKTDLTINEDAKSAPINNENEIISRRERVIKPRAEQTEIGQVARPMAPIKQVVKDIKYNPPPITLLKENKEDTSKYVKNYEENARLIEEKLETFRIPAKVVDVVRGPTVTRYELTMPSGIPVKKILNYDSDLAMALRSKSGVRIEAPIPGKNAVGIEVPNDPRSMVSFRELMESKEFVNSTATLPVAIGKNISGEVVVKSLAKMVHLLVAGSTGSGKSVFLHSLIMSLMFKMSPEQLRFIMIDPKRVEFSRYKGMPHMMLPDVVSDAERAINSLGWAVKEMERRYRLLEENKCQKLEIFNQCDAVKKGEQKKLPYIVIVVDELAELMGVAKREVEEKIRRISQLGRASGIHLVLATQRPSVEVVTGTIKTNLPSRIAFALSSFIDSKTILDEPGAEKLLGQGDMLFAPQESNTPIRLQGAYISDDEIDKCIAYIKENNECNYDEEVEKEIYSSKEEQSQTNTSSATDDHSDQMDELLPQALKFFIENGKGSISMIQRRFYVGFNRAARIVDQMELRGYIKPAEGSKNREINITMDEFVKIFGDI